MVRFGVQLERLLLREAASGSGVAEVARTTSILRGMQLFLKVFWLTAASFEVCFGCFAKKVAA